MKWSFFSSGLKFISSFSEDKSERHLLLFVDVSFPNLALQADLVDQAVFFSFLILLVAFVGG